MGFLQKYVRLITIGSLSLLILLMAVLSFPYFEVKPLPSILKAVFLLATLSVFLLLFAFGNSIPKSNFFLAGILILAFSLRLFWVLWAETELVSDFEIFFVTSQKLAEGNFKAINNSGYYNIWPNNMGYPLISGLILAIVKSLTGLKVVSAVFSTLPVYLLYKIAKQVWSLPVARIVGVLAALFPPFILYTSVNTNHTLCIVFVLVALLLFTKKKSYIWVGVCLAIAQFIRPIGVVFWLGMLAYFLYAAIKLYNQGWINVIRKSVVPVILVTLSYWGVLIVLNLGITSFGIDNEGFMHTTRPNYKVLVGLKHDAWGKYNAEDAKLTKNIALYNEKVNDIINKRLADKEALIELFGKKFASMWGSNDDALFWAIPKSNVKQQEQTRPLKAITHCFYVSILFFSLMFLLSTLKKQVVQPTEIFYIFIMLLGFVLVYLVIEIQTRYRYEIYPLFILLAGPGIGLSYDTLVSQLSKRRKTKGSQ